MLNGQYNQKCLMFMQCLSHYSNFHYSIQLDQPLKEEEYTAQALYLQLETSISLLP